MIKFKLSNPVTSSTGNTMYFGITDVYVIEQQLLLSFKILKTIVM